jgi:hypothetical protein
MAALGEALRETIRFETNYHHLSDTLMRLNRPRFRTLGDARCRDFVRHGLGVADGMQLQTIGSVAYLLFLMNWLGSYFYLDPRFRAVHGPLSLSLPEEERIEAARAGFLDLAARHIGERGEIVLARLARLPEHEHLVTDTAIHHRQLHSTLLDLWEVEGEARADYPGDIVEDQAVRSAQALGIDTPLGRRVCLVLVFVLGIGFHRDPLYPWAADKVAEARAAGERPELSLLAYARKRLDATLRSKEG